MNTTQILHRISHVKWLFLSAEVYLILYSFIVMPIKKHQR